MSQFTESAAANRLEPPSGVAALRHLYAVRFVFAIIWAALLAATASTLDPFAVTLLVAYPLFDLGAAVHDLRSTGEAQRVPLLLNALLSLAAAVGLGVASGSGIPDVLRVWGAWAITAGVVQLVVAVRRRAAGGQWPMVLSGALSVLAGGGFVAMASGDGASLVGLAGYAAVGGIFFAVSALRLDRRSDSADR